VSAIQQKRLFHVLTSLITTISFLTYLAMATGEGVIWKYDFVHEKHEHVPDTRQEYFRQIFWVRYVNWILTNPLLIVNLALVSGMNGASLLNAISADLVMFVSGIVATFARHERRWVWYTISCIAYLTLVYQIGFNGRRASTNRNQATQRFFGSFSGATLLVMLLYPMYVIPNRGFFLLQVALFHANWMGCIVFLRPLLSPTG
jgi:bacteriorhodopsin